MIKLYEKEQDCCGCTACASICPKNAITMTESVKGFKYPVINQGLCVECGLCLSVCDFKVFKPTGKNPDSYAVRHCDENEVKTSRSGAFFMGLCKYVIEHGGYVFGCTLTDSLDVKHAVTNSYESCYIFKGSKYVESDMGNCFSECRALLKEGKWVLFSGTGCQIHGLLSFLNKSKVPTETLITVDLVCHGVPSIKVWKDYVLELENRKNQKITFVDFRDKQTFGWKDHVEKYVLNSGEAFNLKSWTDVFYRHVLFRDSCYNCKYTTTQRLSDFTIADYWGISKNAPRFDDNRGVSLVLVHSDKAKRVFEEIKTLFNLEKTNIETSLQPQLRKPISKGAEYGAFWKKYKKFPLKAIKKYFFPNACRRVFLKFEKSAKRFIKKIIRR